MNYKNLNPEDFKLIPKGEKIKARVIELDYKTDFQAFVFCEKDNTFSCLLPVFTTAPELPKINGLTIQYQLFGITGSEMKNYILIECQSIAYLTNYTEILKEILSEYDKGNTELNRVINKVISKWRHFLAQPSSLILKEDEIVGLIGELLLLSKLIDLHGADALSIWIAEKGSEDFINDGKVIEVKTTLKEKHEHVINGIDQLLVKPSRIKHILSIIIARSISKNSISLPLIVKGCSEKFSEDPISFDLFYKKLKYRGYDERDQLEYLNYTYDYIRGGYFKVDKSFPKLTNDQLITPLSSRISKVRYLLDMEGLSNNDFLSSDLNEII